MIPTSFYKNPDCLEVARSLLGKKLLTCLGGELTGGYISEVEGYLGKVDRASHAYGDKRTKRTEVMYRSGGIAYVYLCYGMHHLLNVVTNVEGIPHAVLIRAIVPTIGKEIMLRRRKRTPLASGPGLLTKALGITMEQNGQSLGSDTLWIEDGIHPVYIDKTARIGVDYAGPDASLLYRFIATFANIES